MLSSWYQIRHISSRFLRTAGGAVALTIGFLALTRLLYEWLFPLWNWTGRMEIVVPLAILLLVATAYLLPRTRLWWLPLPLLINLIWLFDPSVELLQSRIVFAASLWLLVSFQLSALSSQLSALRFHQSAVSSRLNRGADNSAIAEWQSAWISHWIIDAQMPNKPKLEADG